MFNLLFPEVKSHVYNKISYKSKKKKKKIIMAEYNLKKTSEGRAV